jgi:hypothetical protein
VYLYNFSTLLVRESRVDIDKIKKSNNIIKSLENNIRSLEISSARDPKLLDIGKELYENFYEELSERWESLSMYRLTLLKKKDNRRISIKEIKETDKGYTVETSKGTFDITHKDIYMEYTIFEKILFQKWIEKDDPLYLMFLAIEFSYLKEKSVYFRSFIRKYVINEKENDKICSYIDQRYSLKKLQSAIPSGVNISKKISEKIINYIWEEGVKFESHSSKKTFFLGNLELIERVSIPLDLNNILSYIDEYANELKNLGSLLGLKLSMNEVSYIVEFDEIMGGEYDLPGVEEVLEYFKLTSAEKINILLEGSSQLYFDLQDICILAKALQEYTIMKFDRALVQLANSELSL